MVHGGSPGGARPKVTLARNPLTGHSSSGFRPLKPGYAHWLVKFRAMGDPVDMGRAERAYAELASRAGLKVAPADLIEMQGHGRSEAFFATRRFDRDGDRKIHMLSMAGLLHASHRTPSIDYDQIINAVRMVTRTQSEADRAYRLMVFNAVFHNRDDHSKNFAFLYQDGAWTMSPAYDLSMNAGMNMQHMSAINGTGDPHRKDLLAVAGNMDIRQPAAIIEQVLDAARQWKAVASGFDVGRELTNDIGSRITRMIRQSSGQAQEK
jgi:serine/threonine-protein kinase HipA